VPPDGARQRPTIRDVAERAGVHPATASRALNPALPGRITETTARRVARAARELGYRADPAARSLRTRRSGFVGVVVPDLTNPVLPPIVRGIEEVLWQAGLACLLADTDNRPEREAALVDELRARRCEGLIVATATRTSPTVAGLAGAELPAVLVTRETDDRSLPLVAGDDAAGVAADVGHLVELGHERVAHVTGPRDLSTTARREAAFRAALAQHGLAGEPAVVHGDAFTVPAGRRAAAELLRARRDFSAILAGNDMIALGCYEALAEAGLRCPGDVSVAGHNDMPLMAQVSPPLTTVAIPQQRIGAEAARMLLALLAGDDGASRRVLLPTELVVRGSTSPPAGRASAGARRRRSRPGTPPRAGRA
jgi:LacI family transcriptional regulator